MKWKVAPKEKNPVEAQNKSTTPRKRRAKEESKEGERRCRPLDVNFFPWPENENCGALLRFEAILIKGLGRSKTTVYFGCMFEIAILTHEKTKFRNSVARFSTYRGKICQLPDARR